MAEYWKIGRSTAYQILWDTCEAIFMRLSKTHLAPPMKEGWKEIADGYWKRWNFPHCIGAIDGKHIRMECPVGSGSQFFNYKQYFSLGLIAACDAKYRFSWVEIGDYGSLPDSCVFQDCTLGKAMENGTLNIPDAAPLPGTDVEMPYFFIGDEGFPQREDLMRPYSRRSLRGEPPRIFNYRLSRARLTIENAFGILASRWRVLQTCMGHYPKNIERVVLATVCLHNFIMRREEHTRTYRQYCPPAYADRVNEDGEIEPGLWRRERFTGHITDLGRCGGNRPAMRANDQRDAMANFFLSDAGFVEWQWQSAYRGFEVNVF